MSALGNIHYGFEHHLKWLSPQTVHYLRVYGAISDTACVSNNSSVLILIKCFNVIFFFAFYFAFTFIHLAGNFIQSNLQMRNTRRN